MTLSSSHISLAFKLYEKAVRRFLAFSDSQKYAQKLWSTIKPSDPWKWGYSLHYFVKQLQEGASIKSSSQQNTFWKFAQLYYQSWARVLAQTWMFINRYVTIKWVYWKSSIEFRWFYFNTAVSGTLWSTWEATFSAVALCSFGFF